MYLNKKSMVGSMLAATVLGHLGQNQLAKRMLTEKGGASLVKSLGETSALSGVKNGLRNTLVPEAGIMADEVAHGVHSFVNATRGEKAAALALLKGENLKKVFDSKTFLKSERVQKMAAKIGLTPEVIERMRPREVEAILKDNGVGRMVKGMSSELKNIDLATFGKNRKIEYGVEAVGNLGMAMKEPGIALANAVKRGASARIPGEGLASRMVRRAQKVSSEKLVTNPIKKAFTGGLSGIAASPGSKMFMRNVVNPVSAGLEDMSNQMGLLAKKHIANPVGDGLEEVSKKMGILTKRRHAEKKRRHGETKL